MISILPRHDRVVVLCGAADERKAFGLALPDTPEDSPRQGKVIAVGPGRVLDNGTIKNVNLKKGDRVLFGGFVGSKFTLNDREYVIISEREILATINEAKKGSP